MAAATVGRFVGARARLVGAHAEPLLQHMVAIGLHVLKPGFAQPLRPPSPSSDKPVEPPPLGRHRGGSLRCVKKGARFRVSFGSGARPHSLSINVLVLSPCNY